MTVAVKKNYPDDAFVELVKNNQGILHKICNLYSSTREDRQDLYQEIVLQLWKSFNSFRGDCKITTWMYKIALNTALTNIKRVKRQPGTTEIDDGILNVAEKDEKAFDEDDIKILYIAIGRLRDIEKAIILLYLEDNSYDEIAAIVGITAKNVSVKLVRIKSKLEQIISSLNK